MNIFTNHYCCKKINGNGRSKLKIQPAFTCAVKSVISQKQSSQFIIYESSQVVSLWICSFGAFLSWSKIDHCVFQQIHFCVLFFSKARVVVGIVRDQSLLRSKYSTTRLFTCFRCGAFYFRPLFFPIQTCSFIPFFSCKEKSYYRREL